MSRRTCPRCGAVFESIATLSAAAQLVMHLAWCCAKRSALLLLVLMLLGAAPAAGQVPSRITISDGSAAFPVMNGGTRAALVTFDLHHGVVTDGGVTLVREVRALVSPSEVTLRPVEVP